MAEKRRRVSGHGVPSTDSNIFKRAKLHENQNATKMVLEEKDRLSALPESLLLHILSFLDAKNVVRTCVLSRRFQFFWTDCSEFVFRDDNKQLVKRRRFVDWVSKTLVICSGNYLKRFEVRFNYNDCFASSVNGWVQFLTKNKVEDVVLELSDCGEGSYLLPQMMYFNSSLTYLGLQNCIIAPPPTMEWKSLTTLSIWGVELSGYVMKTILSGCPVLEYLVLTKCWGTSCLNFNTRSLKQVLLRNWIETGSLLVISAPYIKRLLIRGHSIGETDSALRLIGVSPLVVLQLDFNKFHRHRATTNAKFMDYMKELIESIRHVEKLVLGSWFFELLSVLNMKGWRLPQYSCTHLWLNVSTIAQSFPGLLCMLESSPNMKSLYTYGKHSPRDEVYTGSLDLKCDLLKLKKVELTNFGGPYTAGHPALELVRLLLERALNLEKMVIAKESTGSSSTLNSSDYLKIAQMVLSYPRSSPKAVVQLHY